MSTLVSLGADALMKLWDHLFGDQGGYLAVFSGRRPGPGAKTLDDVATAYFAYPSQAAAALAAVEQEAGRQREVYYCAHLLTDRRRKKEHATHLHALYVDGDGAQVPPALPQPTAIVESSPKRQQFYWRLTRDVAPSVGEQLNKRLAYAMGADKSGWDLTQLLRPPGTRNHKYADTPLVRLVHLDPDMAYDPAWLDEVLPPLPGAHTTPSEGTDAHEPPVRLYGAALARWRGEQAPHHEDGSVDRSRALFAIGCDLRRAGASSHTIAAALQERDEALGWTKYSGRDDADQRYAEIAEKVLTEAQDTAGPRLNSSSSSSSLGGDDDDDDPAPGRGPRLLTLATLREQYSAEVDWLVEGYIARGELTMLVAPPESLKSWAMADLTRAVLTGGRWLDHFDVPQGQVIYIEQERASNLVYQTELLARAYACDLDALLVIPPGEFRLLDPTSQAALTAFVQAHHPVLVVVNSYRSAFLARSADPIATARALGWLGQLAERERVAVVVIDGTNKAGGTGLVRGMAAHGDSLQKEYEADTVLHVERDRDDVGRGTGPARLYTGKRRAGTAGDPFSFEVLPHHPAGVHVSWRDTVSVERSTRPAPLSGVERLAAALHQASAPVSIEALSEQTGLAAGTVKNMLTTLKRAGRAAPASRGLWASSSSSLPLSDDDDDDDANLRLPHGDALGIPPGWEVIG